MATITYHRKRESDGRYVITKTVERIGCLTTEDTLRFPNGQIHFGRKQDVDTVVYQLNRGNQ